VQYPSVFSRFVGTVPDRFGFAMLVARANAVGGARSRKWLGRHRPL